MKRTFLSFIFLFLSVFAQGTECSDRYFHGDKISLYLCQNYSDYHETTALLFKARTKILDDYIKERIRRGELKDKKFEIQIYDEILSTQHLYLTQNQHSYHINTSGYDNLAALKAYIDYFASPNWKPFTRNKWEDGRDVNPDIQEFLETYSRKEMYGIPSFNVWSSGNVQLRYVDDELKYFLQDSLLAIKANFSLPVRIKDRYLLFQDDAIFVLQGKEIILEQSLVSADGTIRGDYSIYTGSKWVNICEYSGEDSWLYSYFYNQNKFYKRPER